MAKKAAFRDALLLFSDARLEAAHVVCDHRRGRRSVSGNGVHVRNRPRRAARAAQRLVWLAGSPEAVKRCVRVRAKAEASGGKRGHVLPIFCARGVQTVFPNFLACKVSTNVVRA